MSGERGPLGPRGRVRFATTRWSLVLAATGSPPGESEEALAELCTEYWYPLYAYVRRRGYVGDLAQDLTQAFFAKLLEGKDLAAADPARGRFRTFLLTSLQNFLASEWRKEAALKRGGGLEIVALDFSSAEERYRVEPTEPLSPEAVYERRWGLGVLGRALDRLRQQYESAGKLELFEALKGFLGQGADVAPYAELSSQLGRSEGSLRTAVSRLRRRWRQQLRQLVAETVASEDEIDDELRHLLAVISGR